MKFACRWFPVVLVVLVLPVMAMAQGHGFPSMSIRDVRTDSDGDCVADDAAIADTVCDKGVVLAWKEFGNSGAGAIWDPESGWCISVFDIPADENYVHGDTIEVCGWVGSFAGLAEIEEDPATGLDPTIVFLMSGTPVAAVEVTFTDLADGSLTADALESCYVSLCGSFVDQGTFNTVSANYVFKGVDGGSCTVRIMANTDIGGTEIPVGPVTVTGILGQFNGFVAECSGFQLQPRSTADFVTASCQVAVEEKSWSDIKALYREED